MSWAEIVKKGLEKEPVITLSKGFEEIKKKKNINNVKNVKNDNNVKNVKNVKNTPYLIDIGSNLTSSKFTHCFNEVIERARLAGVKKQIVTGGTLDDSISAQKIAHNHPGELYSTAGIHPHNANEFTPEIFEDLKSLLKYPEVVAIGETGLDYFRNISKPEFQKKSFKAHLELAIEVNKPLFLHERDAHEDFIEIFKEVLYKKQLKWEDLPPVVVHCFTGKAKHLEKYISIGFYIGITGYVGIKGRGEHLHRYLSNMVPLDRLMIETDAPYMRPSQAPRLPSGQNEPANLKYVAKKLSELYQVSEEEIWIQTTKNAEKFFNLN